MSFIAKNPLTIPEVEFSPSVPQAGTRGIFAGKDGWYDIDSEGSVSKLLDSSWEAPKDGKPYARKNGAWTELEKELPEITIEAADDVYEGVYRIKKLWANDWVYGLLCASYNINVYEYVDIGAVQTILWSNGKIEHRERVDYLMDLGVVVQNPDSTYKPRPGYVFEEPWSAWQSVVPSLAGYAKTAYVNAKIEDAKAYKVVCEGELDDTTSGVAAIKAEITEDISKMREFKFYIEFPVTEENAGTNTYINANINGAPAGNNSFCSVGGLRVGVAGNTYYTMCTSSVVEGADGLYILSMEKQIQEKNVMGTSTRTNAQTASAAWVIPRNTTLYLNINNTVSFLSGTKWRLEGR